MKQVHDIFYAEIKLKVKYEETRVLSKNLHRIERVMNEVYKKSNKEIELYKIELKDIIQNFLFDIEELNKKHNIKDKNHKLSLLEEEFMELK